MLQKTKTLNENANDSLERRPSLLHCKWSTGSDLLISGKRIWVAAPTARYHLVLLLILWNSFCPICLFLWASVRKVLIERWRGDFHEITPGTPAEINDFYPEKNPPSSPRIVQKVARADAWMIRCMFAIPGRNWPPGNGAVRMDGNINLKCHMLF